MRRGETVAPRLARALVVAAAAVRLSRGRSLLERTPDDQALVSAGAALMGAAAGVVADELVRRAAYITRDRGTASALLAGGALAAWLWAAGRNHAGTAAKVADSLGGATAFAVGTTAVGGRLLGRAPALLWAAPVWETGRAVASAMPAWRRLQRRLAEPVDPVKASISYDYLPTVSGAPGSLAPLATLDREGRKFLALAVPAASIEAILGPPARDPIRVYVGLETAATPAERSRIALDELERLGGLVRRRIVVACPSGAGFVMPVPVQAEEFMMRGDVASVVVQYNNQRSHRSLGKVGVACETYWALFEGLRERLTWIGEGARPELVVYGESLGAWIAAEMLADGGLRLLDEFRVARGALVGVPYEPRRRLAQMHERERALPESVGVFSLGSELEALPGEVQERLRYVFLTHPEDPVSNFSGRRLLWERPPWLAPPSKRNPRIPSAMRWLPGITYLQLLFDVKNSTSFAAQFADYGHDYRLEMPEVIRVAFGHRDLSPDRLESIARWMAESARAQARREAGATPGRRAADAVHSLTD